MRSCIGCSLRNLTLAAAFGVVIASLPSGADATSNSPAVRECVRVIALQERTAARQFKGDERREMISALGKVKRDCMNGKIQQAYRAAAKLRGGPQTARAGN